jgi:hypothetical protein
METFIPLGRLCLTKIDLHCKVLLADSTIPIAILGACSCTQSAHPANHGGGTCMSQIAGSEMACGAS